MGHIHICSYEVHRVEWNPPLLAYFFLYILHRRNCWTLYKGVAAQNYLTLKRRDVAGFER